MINTNQYLKGKKICADRANGKTGRIAYDTALWMEVFFKRSFPDKSCLNFAKKCIVANIEPELKKYEESLKS